MHPFMKFKHLHLHLYHTPESFILCAGKQDEKGRYDDSLSELDYYLTCEFDLFDYSNVLQWWSKRSERFPIMSKIVREILSSPVSAVASELAISEAERIVDKKELRLTPNLIQSISARSGNWLTRERNDRQQILLVKETSS